MRITVAAKAIEKIIASYASANNFINEEDLPVIQKYIAAGVIKLARSKMPLQSALYKPALEHPAVENLPYPAWLYIFQHYAKQYKVKTALSRTQTAEYIFNCSRYKMCPVVGSTVIDADKYINDFKEYLNDDR